VVCPKFDASSTTGTLPERGRRRRTRAVLAELLIVFAESSGLWKDHPFSRWTWTHGCHLRGLGRAMAG
jgi:hypothetical protein